MSLKRICEIGIGIGLILILKNVLFQFILSDDLKYTFAIESPVLSNTLDYGLSFSFMFFFILYLRKKGFNIAALFTLALLVVNIRYIYVYLNLDFTNLDTIGSNVEKITREVLIQCMAIAVTHLVFLLTAVRKLILLRIYAIIQVILAIILYRQTISPDFDMILIVRYISSALPALIIIQYFIDRVPIDEKNAELLDDGLDMEID